MLRENRNRTCGHACKADYATQRKICRRKKRTYASYSAYKYMAQKPVENKINVPPRGGGESASKGDNNIKL